MKRVVPLLITAPLLLTACGLNSEPSAFVPAEATTTSAASSAETPTVETTTVTAEPKRELPPNVRPGAESTGAAAKGAQSRGSSSCGSQSVEEAVNANIHQVTPDHWEWDPTYIYSSDFDPCLPLSWAVVGISHASASSPFQIMLFHHGEYLGTGTYDAYGFMPTVVRTDPNTIDVTYHWSRPGEGTANRSGSTWASFTWDDSAERVIMSGDVPPT
ncbi:MAG: LppP/LprE family lipoprotein [Corynebacterium sp.]|nr:LppP/LprE family lipoprotein [Corynebacterium sp.]